MAIKNPVLPGRDGDPCVRNCCLDHADVCLGCGRKLSEILEWHDADPMRREVILDLANKRLVARRWLDPEPADQKNRA